MAENIVAGLFGLTPEMYGEQQRRSALREGIDLAKLTPGEAGAAMTYAGARGLTGAIGGALGIEDPQLQRITQRCKNYDRSAMLIIVSPVEPTMDRIYIGRTFCVVVLAGMGSMSGTLVAGLVLGITESIVLTLFGASWATAVAFGLLLLMLGLRPQGLFGR